METLKLRVHPCYHNDKPALQFRQVITINNNHKPFLEKFLSRSLKGEPTEMLVKIEFYDELRAYAKLQSMGVKLEKGILTIVEKNKLPSSSSPKT